MPAADILAFIASAIVIIYTYRTLKKDEKKARLNKSPGSQIFRDFLCFVYAMFSSAFMNFRVAWNEHIVEEQGPPSIEFVLTKSAEA